MHCIFGRTEELSQRGALLLTYIQQQKITRNKQTKQKRYKHNKKRYKHNKKDTNNKPKTAK